MQSSVEASAREDTALQCGLADVEALLGHLDRAPEPWRAATRSACEALHAAVLEVSFICETETGHGRKSGCEGV